MIAVSSDAVFSGCRTFRYTLRRIWNVGKPLVTFVGLNPSTADESIDDPTVRRCAGFAARWGFGGLILTNIFAYRSTDPKALLLCNDPIGPENDYWIQDASRSAQATIVAWGIHGRMFNRENAVLAQLKVPYCLGTTKGGCPRHPLYLSGNTRRRRFFGLTG